MNNKLTILAVGDCILYHKEPIRIFDFVKETLQAADITFGQNELPMTNRAVATCSGSSFIRTPDLICCDPETAGPCFKEAGFDIVSNAGNHVWDGGIPGIYDTLDKLDELGIASCGMGKNISEARKATILERKGTKVAFLSYNLTGPEETWANSVKPGCAYIRVIGEYIPEEPCKGCAAKPYTACSFEDMEKMRADIEEAKSNADIVIVNFHQGIGLVRAVVADYEKFAARYAIDSGADIIIGEHAHIVKGIETYKGKYIFYGMGDFTHCFKKRFEQGMENLTKEEMEVAQRTHDVTGQWANVPDELCELLNYKIGDKPLCGMPPEALITFIVKIELENNKISRVSVLPCIENGEDQPMILGHDRRGEIVYKYLNDITSEAQLHAPEFSWDGNEILLKANE